MPRRKPASSPNRPADGTPAAPASPSARRVVAAAVVLAAVAFVLFRGWPERRTGGDGPVVLISIDTLRADHLPAYGYSGVRTPAIDALAADGVVFERAYSHSPQTLPAHASIFSGELPFEHGVRDNVGFTVRENQRTLPQLLRAHGYVTGGVVSSYVLREETGIGGGFDFYDSQMPPASPEAGIGQVQRDGLASLDAATRWLQGLASNRFFLFLHLYEPHKPYAPPAEYAAYAPYDGEIAYADQIVGRFIAELRQRGVYDDATVILLSDHGEGLGDHDEEEHGVFLYNATTHVPLIIKLPRSASAGRRVSAPVQHADLLPTLLDLAGMPRAEGLRGRSLRPLLEGSGSIPATGIYAEAMYPRYHFGWSELYTLTEDRYRYVKAPREELYDLQTDPGEQRNLAAGRAQPAAAMRAALDQLTAGQVVATPSAVSPEARARLQALGYVGTQTAVAPDVSGSSLPDPKDKVHVLASYRRAVDLAGRGEQGPAIELLRDILREDPDMADVWLQLGTTLVRAGRVAEAADALKRFVQMKPSDPGGLLAVAGALLKLGQRSEARAHAELAINVAPAEDRSARASAHEMLARIAVVTQDAAEARRQAELAQKADPQLPLPVYIRARLLHQEGRYGEAWPLFEEALRQAGSRTLTMTELHFYAGDTLARLGRNAEAEAQFLQEIRLFPHHGRARAGLAMLYQSLQRDREAAQAIEALVEHVPTPEGYDLAAQLWTMFGEPQQAAAVRAASRRQFGAGRSR